MWQLWNVSVYVALPPCKMSINVVPVCIVGLRGVFWFCPAVAPHGGRRADDIRWWRHYDVAPRSVEHLFNLAERFTLAPCSWTYNLQVVHSGVQLSSWHSAVVSTRCHSACCWCNVAPSTAVCIVIRSCGASNTSFIAWRPSLCGCWTTRMEQSTRVRHWLLVTTHLQEISQDLFI